VTFRLEGFLQTLYAACCRRLTSPFTLHWTLNQILQTFTDLKQPNDALDSRTNHPIRRKHRYSFFQEVPQTISCEEMGVPEMYCACYALKHVDVQDSMLYTASLAAVHKVNSQIINGTSCSQLKVAEITAGAVMEKSTSVRKYVVGFVTSPGSFLIEAEVDYFVGNGTFNSNEASIQRASRIKPRHTQCINDAVLELFCYCKKR
jgi:hypothetical protein